MSLLLVPLYVSADFLAPELFAALWPSEQMAVVGVPKTAMDEENGITAGEYQIGLSGKVFAVQPKAESAPVKRGSDGQLGFGVLALDP